MVSLGQKLKMSKACEEQFYKNIRFVLCKKPVKKRQIFQKRDNFENRPSCKAYSPCKGLCKMVNLGKKLKIPKTCKKPFYKNIKGVLCRKPIKKHHYIREIRQFLKSAILQKATANPKPIVFFCKMVSVG